MASFLVLVTIHPGSACGSRRSFRFLISLSHNSWKTSSASASDSRWRRMTDSTSGVKRATRSFQAFLSPETAAATNSGSSADEEGNARAENFIGESPVSTKSPDHLDHSGASEYMNLAQ